MRLTVKDAKIANKIIHHPKVYPYITDDYAVFVEPHLGRLGEFFLNQEMYYVLNPCKGVLFILTPRNLTTYEVHSMALPNARGSKVIEAGQDAIRWMFENTTCEKIISWIPEDNKRAKIFALRSGFKVEGLITKSIKRNGVLLDQWEVAIEKERFLCQ